MLLPPKVSLSFARLRGPGLRGFGFFSAKFAECSPLTDRAKQKRSISAEPNGARSKLQPAVIA